MNDQHSQFAYADGKATAAPFSPSEAAAQPTAGTPRFDAGANSFGESDERGKEALQRAREIFNKQQDWVTFYREVLGLNGIVRQCHPTPEAMSCFEKSQEFEEIQIMLAKLREKHTSKQSGASGPTEATRVITVRLPKCLHESLRTEAHDKRTSMNKLCISKLVQFIDEGLVPAEA